MTTNKCCGTCKHWKEEPKVDKESRNGYCTYTISKVQPSWVFEAISTGYFTRTFATFGKDCVCYVENK